MPSFEDIPADEKPCAQEVNAPVDEKPCTPATEINQSVQACAPFPNNNTGWVSTKCYTANCPSGTVGQSITRCATATSDVSQADADTRALAQAQLDAEGDLVCITVPTFSEATTLALSISGLYEAQDTAVESTTLLLALFGEYAIPPNEDSSELALSLSGENSLIPFEEYAPLTLTISPLSEYRLETLFEFTDLNLDLLGVYEMPVIFTPDVEENTTLALALSGTYATSINAEEFDDDKELALEMSGVYALIVQQPPDQIDEHTLALDFTAEYVLRIIDLPERQFQTTLSLSLSGVYA